VILLIDNYDSFTWNLVHRLGEIDRSLAVGRDLVVVRNDAVSAEAVETIANGGLPSHIVISPGPCTPREAGVSNDILRRFAGRVPILGVCLGHQCMGFVAGMTVTRHVHPVHGKTSPVHHAGRGVFAGLPQPFDAARYHSLVILEDSIPREPDAQGDRWEVSAWTDEVDEVTGATRRVVMGLRRAFADPSRKPLEGVQFHPESFMTPAGVTLLANFLRM
jgi:anthranilate synthase/aminodeoxychorismate synthase-like glutamine amidotransferase